MYTAPMASIKTIWDFQSKCHEGVPILMFHKVGRCPAAANMPRMYVSPAHLNKLMDLFHRKALRSISISDALEGNTRRKNCFVISFDDAYEGALIHALPIMKKHGFSAIVFIVADLLGQRNNWCHGEDTTMEPLMTRTQVEEWLSAGFEIGAHTLTHPRLTSIPLLKAKNEIAGSKRKLEDLFGVPVRHFAYPWGDYNSAVMDLVEEAGFRTACSCDPGVVTNGVNRFRLPRFDTDERSVRSFSTYKLAYLSDDFKNLAARGMRAAGSSLEAARLKFLTW